MPKKNKSPEIQKHNKKVKIHKTKIKVPYFISKEELAQKVKEKLQKDNENG